jgi:hypothetical protein
MQNRSIYTKYASILLAIVLVMAGCSKKEYALPTAKDALQNDAIKRTLGPNIVGQQIEFAYAMALPATRGKLTSAQVTASIEGAAGTFMENRSFNTNASGVDVGVQVGSPSVNAKEVTTVTFTKDTFAATLRYYYVIPEAARGKTVSFTFTATSSDGQTVTYKMGPFTVAKMYMTRNITVTDNNLMYISLADMKAYNAADAATNAAKIDLVYLYRNLTTSAFNHALVAPAASSDYLPGVTLPAGVNRTAKLRKVFNLQDYNLALLQYGIYIDDLDFQQLNVADEPNFAINLKAEAGVWVETADGKIRAYVYINSINNGAKSAVISIKRYDM